MVKGEKISSKNVEIIFKMRKLYNKKKQPLTAIIVNSNGSRSVVRNG